MVVRGSKEASAMGGLIAGVVGAVVLAAVLFYLYGRSVFEEVLEEPRGARRRERSNGGPP